MIAAVPCGKLGVRVTGVAPRSGKETAVELAGAELKEHVGHRARKGHGLKSKLKVAGLQKLAPPAH